MFKPGCSAQKWKKRENLYQYRLSIVRFSIKSVFVIDDEIRLDCVQTVEILPRLSEKTIQLRGDARRATNAPAHTAPARVLGDCDGITVQHHTHEQLRGWGSENTSGVAVLAHEFFKYFARDFDWDKHIVSVTARGLLPKVCASGASSCACSFPSCHLLVFTWELPENSRNEGVCR